MKALLLDDDPYALEFLRAVLSGGPLGIMQSVMDNVIPYIGGEEEKLETEIDHFVVMVRENTEGEYTNLGGVMYAGTEREIVIQESLNQEFLFVHTVTVLIQTLLSSRVSDANSRLSWSRPLYTRIFKVSPLTPRMSSISS